MLRFLRIKMRVFHSCVFRRIGPTQLVSYVDHHSRAKGTI